MKHQQYAPYLSRSIAFMIDFLLLITIYFFASRIVLQNNLLFSQLPWQIGIFTTTICSFVVLLSLLEISPLQSTFGKFLFRLKVVTYEGKLCSFRQALVRNSIKIFTSIYLFMIFFHFESVNNYLVVGIFLSISTNPVWHNFMTITGGEKHLHRLVHDEVARTMVIRVEKS